MAALLTHKQRINTQSVTHTNYYKSFLNVWQVLCLMKNDVFVARLFIILGIMLQNTLKTLI